MDKVKIGVIGVGALGKHHARLYAALPEVALVGVYDRDAATAERVAAEYQTRAFATVEELAAAHISGRRNFGRQLWALLVFAIWWRRVKGRGRWVQ